MFAATAAGTEHLVTSEQTITFLATPWTVIAAVVAWLIVAGFSFVAWRRSGYRPAIGALEALRLSILALIGLILNQPEWVETYHPTEKPSIAVLWDGSATMPTRDALPAGSPTATPVTRREAVDALTKEDTWKSLRERFDVAIEPFSQPKAGSGTNIPPPLTSAVKKTPARAAVGLV